MVKHPEKSAQGRVAVGFLRSAVYPEGSQSSGGQSMVASIAPAIRKRRAVNVRAQLALSCFKLPVIGRVCGSEGQDVLGVGVRVRRPRVLRLGCHTFTH